jgi:hypothetical protein
MGKVSGGCSFKSIVLDKKKYETLIIAPVPIVTSSIQIFHSSSLQIFQPICLHVHPNIPFHLTPPPSKYSSPFVQPQPNIPVFSTPDPANTTTHSTSQSGIMGIFSFDGNLFETGVIISVSYLFLSKTILLKERAPRTFPTYLFPRNLTKPQQPSFLSISSQTPLITVNTITALSTSQSCIQGIVAFELCYPFRALTRSTLFRTTICINIVQDVTLRAL